MGLFPPGLRVFRSSLRGLYPSCPRTLSTSATLINTTLQSLGLQPGLNKGVSASGEWIANGEVIESNCPTTGETLARIQCASQVDYDEAIHQAKEAQRHWRNVPAPARGQLIFRIRNSLHKNLSALATLLSLENGKVFPEAVGEVQEFIDIADVALGLSRSLNGFTIPSERPGHAMLEMYHPLGTVGIISAFNFPVAVFGWASSIALVCGNPVVWKGSETTPLLSVAVTRIVQEAIRAEGLPAGLMTCITGGPEVGNWMAEDGRLDLLSFTGSTKTGRQVGQKVISRFGRPLLELGGNNAMIIMNDVNLDLAVRAVLFAAVGTCGQRCTTARRLLVQEEISGEFIRRLVKAYESINIGDPLDNTTLVGPLHTSRQVDEYKQLLSTIVSDPQCELVYGNRVLSDMGPQFVVPSITRVPAHHPVMQKEVFVPVLHTATFKTFEEAIEMNNSVGQGLSSALFTADVGNAFKWIGPSGADTGIVNVNIGTSGAEVGGAFGGEKETGGGRQAGSDSWKYFMRRQTCTINYSGELPLAQGINFG